MDKTLTLRYDKVGDILYIKTCPPYTAQESEEIGDGSDCPFESNFGRN